MSCVENFQPSRTIPGQRCLILLGRSWQGHRGGLWSWHELSILRIILDFGSFLFFGIMLYTRKTGLEGQRLAEYDKLDAEITKSLRDTTGQFHSNPDVQSNPLVIDG